MIEVRSEWRVQSEPWPVCEHGPEGHLEFDDLLRLGAEGRACELCLPCVDRIVR